MDPEREAFRLSRVSLGGAVAVLLVVLACMLYAGPFYGLMDDATLLRQGQSMRELGFPAVWSAFVWEDLHWGMLRPFYPPMAAALYGFGDRSPLAVFVTNFFFVVACLVCYGLCWRRVLASSLPAGRAGAASFLGSFLIIALAFPWTHDLFLHPSLQEKLVLLGGGAALAFFAADTGAWPFPKFALLATLVLALGFLTKAQFAMFVPALCLLSLGAGGWQRWKKGRAAFVTCVAGGMVLALRALALRGTYTPGRYTLGNVLPNLRDYHSLLLLALATVYGLFLCFRRPGVGLRSYLPIVVVVGYLAVFLPWGIYGYLLSSAGAVLAVAGAAAWSSLRGWPARLALSAFLVVSLAVSSYRSYTFFGRLADLREILASPELEKINESGKPLFMGCLEGSDAFRYYLTRFRGLNLSVREIKEMPPRGSGFFLGDTKLCPLPGAPSRVVRASRYPGGFTIYE